MKISELLNLKRVWGLTLKEAAILLRDKPAMVIIFAIPTVLIITITYGQQTGYFEPPRIAVVDLDNSEGFPDVDMSREFVKTALEFHTREEISLRISNNLSYLYTLLGVGQLDSIIYIPNGFEYNLSIGYPTIIEIQIDANNLLLYQFAQEKVDEVVQEFKDKFNIHGIFNPEVELYLRPENATRLFDIAPFFFPWTLFSIGTAIACQVIVSDIPKHRMALTPTNKFEISLGKIAGIQLLLSGLCLEMVFLSYLFGFQSLSTPVTYYLVLWIVSLAGVTLGFMLSSFAKTPLAALQFFIFFFLLQAIVIFFIPWEDILYIFPVYNGQFLMLNTVIRGQSLQGLYHTNIILFILTTFLLGYIKYRRLPTLV